MTKSEYFNITPEESEQIRLRRIESVKKLTLEYQLGWYIGEDIVRKYLPTLSVDMLQTRTVINVSEEEKNEAERLNNVWYANYDEKAKNDPNWIALRKYHVMLEEKYLPQVLECHIPSLNVENMGELKKGIRAALWDSDLCHYAITEDDDIEIAHDNDFYFTIVKLKYKKNEYGTD